MSANNDIQSRYMEEMSKQALINRRGPTQIQRKFLRPTSNFSKGGILSSQGSSRKRISSQPPMETKRIMPEPSKESLPEELLPFSTGSQNFLGPEG